MLKEIIENNFFIITSDNLDSVSTKLFGYCITENNIIEEQDLQNGLDFVPNGIGSYIYIKKTTDEITLSQDFYGSYSIYLFRRENYFAISNSFIYLVDYIKTKFPISLNKDYANYLLTAGFTSEIYAETLVNEIKTLDRNAIIKISSSTKKLEINYIDCKENSLNINSSEGIQALDSWFERWTAIIRNICSLEEIVTFDLSGGFDSRMILLLMLNAGIDLKKIWFNTCTDTLHTHVEDLEIAKKLAERYGFKLNDNHGIKFFGTRFNMQEIVGTSFYVKLGFHKQMFFNHGISDTRAFVFIGGGGEISEILSLRTLQTS